jgi:hypothetical protein
MVRALRLLRVAGSILMNCAVRACKAGKYRVLVCTAPTTSCDRPVEVRLRKPHPTGIQAPIHAGAWMRIAEKKPSTHSGE